jgi:hypothetical protein
MNVDRCEFCGAIVAGGYEGCRSLFNEITAQSFSSASHFTIHRAAVDCYALQHPEYFCISAKSYAAHLSGVCVAIEYNSSVEVNAAIQKWLSGSIDLQKTKVLIERGELTVLHIQNIIDPQEHTQHVMEWCADVWANYSELQDVARSYVQAALASK